jgi:hypothetical protein
LQIITIKQLAKCLTASEGVQGQAVFAFCKNFSARSTGLAISGRSERLGGIEGGKDAGELNRF